MPLEIHEDKIIMRAGKYNLPTLDSTGTTAVDRNYFWQPISTCPRGAKVQLLGRGGVAMYGTYTGKDTFYTHWAPLPKLPRGTPDSDVAEAQIWGKRPAWRKLTDEEISQVEQATTCAGNESWLRNLTRNLEAKLKEKNNG